MNRINDDGKVYAVTKTIKKTKVDMWIDDETDGIRTMRTATSTLCTVHPVRLHDVLDLERRCAVLFTR